MDESLNEEQIQDYLKKVNVEWTVVGGTVLERVYRFEDFDEALQFVNKIGEIADKQDHHPEVNLSWGKVVVSLTTHSANGLTEKDFSFAESLD